MKSNKGQDTETVLITGATSGIGEALAREFARHGHKLILIARSASTLMTLANKLADQHKVAATKAYVLSLSEALSEELRSSGITVTALCPDWHLINTLDNALSKSCE